MIKSDTSRPDVSVVVPVYWNEGSLPTLKARLDAVAMTLAPHACEFVFVDDRSGDRSFDCLKGFVAADSRVRAVRLSKNHGSTIANLTGLSRARGRAVVLLAADLQDPPELIPDMVAAWRDGHEVVMATRAQRRDPWSTKIFAYFYYVALRQFALPEMPSGGFDFVLLDRKVVDVLLAIREKNTTLMGLIIWCGFRRKSIPYVRQERSHGRSRWTFQKKIIYFTDSILAFSYVPIRAFSSLGIFIALAGLIYAVWVAYYKFVHGNEVAGWSSLMVAVLLLSGAQLVGLGILGEYLWRTLDEARRRPIFIVDEELGCDPSSAGGRQQDPAKGSAGPGHGASQLGDDHGEVR